MVPVYLTDYKNYLRGRKQMAIVIIRKTKQFYLASSIDTE